MFRTLIDPASLEVPAPKRKFTLVERGPVANSAAWSSFITSRQAKSRSEKRRVVNAIVEDYRQTSLGDGNVLRLLQALACRCPKTPIRDELLSVLRPALASIKVKPIRGVPTEVVDRELLVSLLSIKGPDLTKDGLTEKDFWDYQLVKLLAKYPFAGLETEARNRALQAFWDCEAINAETNRRVRQWSTNHELANELRKHIADLLGDAPDLGEIAAAGTWGPGTNSGYTFNSRQTGAEFKFLAQLSVTPRAYPIATVLLPQYTAWCQALIDTYDQEWSCLVQGSKVTTVRKKFLLDRTITMEALFNSWLQAAIGAIIRKRLKRRGWDLNNSWQLNQQRARIGSLTGLYATEDQTNASNHVCYEVVRALFPSKWFECFELARSPNALLPRIVDGKATETVCHPLEMYSSMGNGFTFELESLLFMAMARVVTPPTIRVSPRGRTYRCWYDSISVFGDDVVLPSAYSAKFREVCKELGMQPNLSKSFAEGPFRESCGQDWYRGVDIRPLFITDRIEDGYEITTLVNRIREFAHRHEATAGYTGFASERWAGMWALAHSYIPSAIRQLNSTPPGVPGGVWNRFGEANLVSYVDTPEGQPHRYKVISRRSAQLNMESTVFYYRGRKHSVLLTGNGNNLLAARLRNQADVNTFKQWDKFHPAQSDMQKLISSATGISCVEGKASMTDLRYTFDYQVTYGSLTEPSRWLGWKRLVSDFGRDAT